ncbi:MAG TPA: adenine deaminase [Bacteroidales bacterium]|nr:adenine deaminase [Bacteroidales bacterium]HBZ19759.1 adenine deaminase [Bacteroidales bacterium]
MKISGQLVDVHKRQIYPAEISFSNQIINKIVRIHSAPERYILPGLTDAHIHIESSMVTPGSFAMAAVSRGTTAVVSDPHEIANVLGIPGVKYMIDDAARVPVKFFFGAPSCVPATSFESSGAIISSDGIRQILENPEIKYLAEMMNFPGVIYNDSEVWKKIEIAHKLNKPIDGHAPGLSGDQLRKYVSAGITTDHECSTIEEAREKIALGMKILIREGSAAKNLDDLKDLIRTDPDKIMLCSDDLHPEMLVKRHLDKLVAGLIAEGFDLFDVIRSCTVNPAMHYGLNTGLLRPGEPADFIVADNLKSMNILETWINGEKVFERNQVLFEYRKNSTLNNFNCSEIKVENIELASAGMKLRVIEASDGDLVTREIITDVRNGEKLEADTKSDILKIVVKDRYRDMPPAVGFIKGFGLKSGAFASSVAHDSHNIICAGTNDQDIVSAVNEIVRLKGGLAVANRNSISSVPLPVAGIMSDEPVSFIASEYEKLSDLVKSYGSQMSAPFMTLSFMALLVIPELKLSDRGLFDGREFRYTSLFKD